MAYLKVFLLSAAPVAEIRGGIPYGVYLGLSGWEAFFAGLLGNVVIILPWLMVLERLEDFFAEYRLTRGFYRKVVRRVEKKKESFRKYGKYALFFFVAVPLPTTGAWTACVAARFFRIKKREAFWVISLGVAAAGLVVLLKVWMFTGGFN